MRVEEIPIDKIVIPKERARATFTEEQFEELKASIKTHGFTVPILVTPLKDGRYLLIDGEHRIKAAKELGYKKVPAVITEGDEKKIHLLNILANTARGTQNPMDVAEALKRALDAGATIQELAAATGHTESWVKLYLALNDLPDEYKQALREGRLKVGHIKECLKLGDPVEIDACLQSALVHQWTVNVTRYYVEQRLADLEKARARGDIEFLEKPPTPEYAKELVSYGECMVCRRKVNRNDLRMPTICEDCYTLLEYVVSQLGDPRHAIQTIYNALSFYFDMLRRQRQEQLVLQQQAQYAANPGTIPEQQVQSQQSQNPQQQQSQETSNILQQLGIDKETLELAKKLKALKEAGLI